MKWLLVLALGIGVSAGCSQGTPSDAEQQQMIKDWSPEKVAQEYEKKGMLKEAEEVRRQAKQAPQ